MNRIIPLSATGYSALACLRAEGPYIRNLLERLFQPVSAEGWNHLRAGEPVFGHWQQADGEEVVVCIVGEEAVEIQCHGGTLSRDLLVESFLIAGCELVSWEDWIAQTSSNPIEAAAKQALTGAKTHRVAMILIDQLHGALRNAIEQVINRLTRWDLPSAVEELSALLKKSSLGTHLKSGWSVTLIGSPNAGKSSLINAILGYQRSIVRAQPGTTRDLLTASTAIEGWPIELIDTAGLRAEGESLEKRGMDLALQQASRSDLVLLVADASCDWTQEQDQWRLQFENVLVAHNKQDLLHSHSGMRPDGVQTVAVNATGVQQLCAQIVQRTVGQIPDHGVAMPFTPGQVETLCIGLDLVEAGKISEAVARLSSLLHKAGPRLRPPYHA